MGFFDDSAGIPGISWDGMARGTVITGVVVADADGKAYRESQQTHIETGAGLTYDNGDPRMQAVITLATDLRGWEACTDKFREKVADDPDAEDDGQRRLYVRGGSMPKEFRAAIKKAKMRDVVEGMTISVTFVGKKPAGEFKSNVFTVEVKPPTPSTLERAASFRDTGGTLSTAAAAGSDDAGDDEPPF